MDRTIVGMLTNLTFRVNDEIKIAAIAALGDYKATIEYQEAIVRIINLCQDPNKEIAVSAINVLSKLSVYFMPEGPVLK
ncbi:MULTISPECIES: HEAT repeat domain-containing protein [Providencia]|uniref:HEAT repeat domain-containing protein n=1 Tax=Providencia TaxID=586 RepID=UPI0034DD74FF